MSIDSAYFQKDTAVLTDSQKNPGNNASLDAVIIMMAVIYLNLEYPVCA